VQHGPPVSRSPTGHAEGLELALWELDSPTNMLADADATVSQAVKHIVLWWLEAVQFDAPRLRLSPRSRKSCLDVYESGPARDTVKGTASSKSTSASAPVCY